MALDLPPLDCLLAVLFLHDKSEETGFVLLLLVVATVVEFHELAPGRSQAHDSDYFFLLQRP